ncbi:multiubiquitin domain-containing protein [Dasania sp. GY-19]|uniref:Multiubiquitin domain-containing protein n=1 Tax=Dasania phycosphaerae TaxID=2950436 RepID=A0A9J6RQ98_9GAMM|nr:multiubiquitin domain-containing protein [Dasania phycosphaerae]MCZ0866747.1 multiubiquitin domain-containing protein [Dasania phycosphaerae]
MNDVTSPNEARVERENIALCRQEGRPLPIAEHYLVQMLDPNGQGTLVEIDDPVPTGRQILSAAGKTPVENHLLLLFDDKGELEAVDLDDTVDVYQRGVEQFFAFDSDRLFYVALNGQRFPWGQAHIGEDVLRRVGCIAENQDIWLERRNEPDHLLADGDYVDLDESGLEKLYTQRKIWKLNVQGVTVSVEQPTIVASDALKAAGFNPDKGWILVLKVKGERKQVIEMSDVIDLRKPGIEKLRLTPAEINNGEAAAAPAFEFTLLDQDVAYLNHLGFDWETRLVGARRWLIIHNHLLPSGYNCEQVDLAIEIPTAYPDAKLDMFFVHPVLTLVNGGNIAQTENRENILGNVYQRWSRHLNGATQWNPLTDSVITHLAVVEESLLREVGE